MLFTGKTYCDKEFADKINIRIVVYHAYDNRENLYMYVVYGKVLHLGNYQRPTN